MMRAAFTATALLLCSASTDDIPLDVLIVGAGQAGMAAAHRLSALGYSLRVLEATGHVGGRTRNVDVRTGEFDSDSDDIIEVGGTWFSPKHSAALTLCKELGLEVFNASFAQNIPSTSTQTPDAEEDWPWWFWGSDYPKEQTQLLKKSVWHGSNGRHLFSTPSELLELLPKAARDELQRAGDLIENAATNISEICWNAVGVSSAWRQFDKYSTWSFLSQTLGSQASQQVLRNCIHGKNAQEPEEVSLLYNLLSFKGCNSAGPDSQYRVRGGTQAIPLKIASKMPEKVLLDSQVVSVTSTESGVELQLRSGRQFSARTAIITGPPPAVLGIEFEPPLRGADSQFLQRMPMGTSLKFAAIYREGPWWRELGLQGDILTTMLPKEFSLPAPDSSLPLFVQCMDHSPFSQRFGVIVCFLEGRQNAYFTQLPQARQQSLMLDFLVKSFNNTRARSLKPTFVAHNWADQPYARGAYTGFFSPGVMSVPAFWDAYRTMEKLPNVFLAGADYHIGFGNGYIEGAIRDGQVAARQVISRLRQSSWSSNGSFLV